MPSTHENLNNTLPKNGKAMFYGVKNPKGGRDREKKEACKWGMEENAFSKFYSKKS